MTNGSMLSRKLGAHVKVVLTTLSSTFVFFLLKSY